MYLYTPIKECLHSDELGEYISYGIEISNGNGFCEKISDVSTDAMFVLELCRKCTDEQLEPIHLSNVIDDEALKIMTN